MEKKIPHCSKCNTMITIYDGGVLYKGKDYCSSCHYEILEVDELENHRMKRQQDREHKIIRKTFELINRIDWDIMNFEYDKTYLINNLKERIKMIEEDLEETGEC